MMYKDLPEVMKTDRCSLCDSVLDDGDSPWSICYDPLLKLNIWGGDTHEYRAFLCQECAEKLLSPNEKAKAGAPLRTYR